MVVSQYSKILNYIIKNLNYEIFQVFHSVVFKWNNYICCHIIQAFKNFIDNQGKSIHDFYMDSMSISLFFYFFACKDVILSLKKIIISLEKQQKMQ